MIRSFDRVAAHLKGLGPCVCVCVGSGVALEARPSSGNSLLWGLAK